VQKTRASNPAFTLLELLTVMVIIAILAVLTFPILDAIRSRVEKSRCMGNLRTLYFGANAYVQQYGQWPQIPTTQYNSNRKAFEKAWVDALQAFQVPHAAWICPTVQRTTGNNADYDSEKTYRVDYIAMPFDSKPLTPYRWPQMPWFVEKGDVHGHGQLIIFTDGSTRELGEMANLGVK
jgi:prepilin-type N-terminal cleavage/methylation domain-containing protein